MGGARIYDVVVIGGGAAGFFAAIHAKKQPQLRVLLLEKSGQVLSKVKISGGGRCNVTHACFDAALLSKHYPRGERELRGAFSRFGAADTVSWFESRGVALKTELDNRIFPKSDNSQSIIDCLVGEARRVGVEIQTHAGVKRIAQSAVGWKLETAEGWYLASQVMLATGSSNVVWDMLAELGHTIVPPVPSLFTFHVKDSVLHELAGLSVPNAVVSLVGTKVPLQTGAVLITHWGFSGPCILRASAWGAIALAATQYKCPIHIQWDANWTPSQVQAHIAAQRQQYPRRQITNYPIPNIPQRLWRYLVLRAGIPESRIWAELLKKETDELINQLCKCPFAVHGKSTFKEEFVTCGGVDLKEVDFRTMQSKLHPTLYFGGEVLNIDAITGGFNFQAAWTTGWIAAQGINQQTTHL